MPASAQAPKYEDPVVVTLLSSFGTQSIAAGTKDVLMARYQFDVRDLKESLGLSSFPLSFEGSSVGLSECVLKDGAGFRHKLQLGKGVLAAIFEQPYAFEDEKSYTFGLYCDISLGVEGNTYRWGIAPQTTFVNGMVATSRIAQQWNGKKGINGQVFLVTSPDIVLNAAVFESISLVGGINEIEAGTQTDVTISLKNDGATKWEAGEYKLKSAFGKDNVLWGSDAIEDFFMQEAVGPGEITEVKLKVRAPEDFRDHVLSWFVAGVEDGVSVLHQPAVLRVKVVASPEPAKNEKKEGSLSTKVVNFFREPSSSVKSGSGGAPSGPVVPSPVSPSIDSAGENDTENIKTPEKLKDIIYLKEDEEVVGAPKVIVEYCDEGPDATEYCDL